MGKKLDLNYFYGPESDQFNFIRIPKPLLSDPMYESLGLEEVVTYSILLDRMSLSSKNGWFDELGRVYVYCSLETVMEYANCKKNKAIEILKNLDAIGLIEKVKIPGRGTKIYVKNFISKNSQKFKNQTLGIENPAPQSQFGVDRVSVDNLAVVDNSNHPSPENQPEVVYFSNPNNNKTNNTDFSNKSIRIIPSSEYTEMMQRNQESEMRLDEMGYADLIRENIELDSLLIDFPHEKEFLTGLYDLILETVLCKSEDMVVASNRYSTNFVRGKLLKLNKFHIEYVMDCWHKNTELPRNVKKYLLAALFNAPSTCDAYITAEVNRDMANPAESYQIANID